MRDDKDVRSRGSGGTNRRGNGTTRRPDGAGRESESTTRRRNGTTRRSDGAGREDDAAFRRESGTNYRDDGGRRENRTNNRDNGGRSRTDGTNRDNQGTNRSGRDGRSSTGRERNNAARKRNNAARSRNDSARRNGTEDRHNGRIIQLAGRRPKKRLKEEKNQFPIRMQKKVVVLYALAVIGFAVLVVRLAWINREDGAQYQKQVLAQQRYDSTVIPYRRGDILDAKGTRLAASEKVYNLVIDAKVMTSERKAKQEYLEPTLQALGEHFADLDMAKIREYVTTHKTSSYYVPLKQLTYEQISGFQAAMEDNKNIKGVWFEEEYKRIYPYDSLAADVIGFSGRDNMGSYGLEEYYNDILNGINGREYGYLNDDQTLERTVKPAVDGYNIHSTIDANIQMIVEKYLNKFGEEHKDEFRSGNGAENIGCIIMEVDSGEVLAMAEYPGYDLNDVRNPELLLGSRMVELVTNQNGYQELRKTDTYINESTLEEMDSDALYLNLNYLWKNFCITGTYEPGSVAKPFTVAAALEEGVISPTDTFECNSTVDVGGYKMGCHNRADGVVTLEQAIAKSCNVTMIKISQILGSEAFCKFQQIFNFGLRTNVDLAGEARTASFVYSADKMGPTDLATNSFGQNFNVTMIEMMSAFCSLINGGKYYEPHMVNKITNTGGATVQNIEPRVLKQTISESTSELIRQYCNAVVSYGSGKGARPPGYAIGGKTGTAETIDPNTHKRSKEEFVVSFMGYAPADNPQIAIYVVVDRPNVQKQSQSMYAQGIARSILMEVLPYLNIFMTEELTDEEKQELAALQLEITSGYTKPEEGGGDGDEPSQTPTGGGVGMTFPIDPATGYRVDPDTGERFDAQTGFAVDGAESVPNPDLPVNPNL